MSYVTVNAGTTEHDLEAQFRAFVLGGQTVTSTEAVPMPEDTATQSTASVVPVDKCAAVRIPCDQIARQISVNTLTGEVLSTSGATQSALPSSSSQSSDRAGVLHFMVQCFLDHVLIFITEDETCAPGVMVRYDPFHNGASKLLYDEEVPSVECTVLFGMRDHPLTNLIASTIAHAIGQYGETRPLLMGISVVRTARRLAGATPQVRKDLLTLIKTHVMRLAVGP